MLNAKTQFCTSAFRSGNEEKSTLALNSFGMKGKGWILGLCFKLYPHQENID